MQWKLILQYRCFTLSFVYADINTEVPNVYWTMNCFRLGSDNDNTMQTLKIFDEEDLWTHPARDLFIKINFLALLSVFIFYNFVNTRLTGVPYLLSCGKYQNKFYFKT